MFLLSSTELVLTAVCWDSQCYRDLEYFSNNEGYKIDRVDPDRFLTEKPDSKRQYVNLVTHDMDLRKKITQHLGDHPRFSFINDKSDVDIKNIGAGCVIYPFVSAVNCKVSRDVICFGHNGLAHGCYIGTGSIVGTFTHVSGSSVVGDFCHLFTRVTIYDKVNIVDDVVIAAGSYVRKSIDSPGHYTSTSTGSLKRIVQLDPCV